MKYILLLSALITLAACTSPKPSGNQAASQPEVINKALTKADRILANTVQAHGGALYDQAHYSFTFRKRTYTFQNNGDAFRYTVDRSKDGREVIDILDQDSFQRLVNGKLDSLTQKQIAAYTGSINSVIYFATLPHKLQDPAVNLEYKGTTTINEGEYEILEVYFDQEGGGQDHDDEFYYWINKETSRIDFLAYNYRVNGGGVRFRSAYNTRNVEGIIFQDYVNYKAPLETPLADLPALFEQEKLEKLSLIETENVKAL